MPVTFNNRLRQLLLLALIILLARMLLNELYVFITGFLGAITLYILFRNSFFKLTIVKKWNSSLIAMSFILASLFLFAIPVYFSVRLLSSRLVTMLGNSEDLQNKAKLIGNNLEVFTGMKLLTDANLRSFQQELGIIATKILNSSAGILSNFAVMFFLLYFLLINGKLVEKTIQRMIPLKDENIVLLGTETINMVRANALGIPVLAILHGIVATIGYAIFGVHEFALWGFITGIFSMIPVVGNAVVWIPLTAYFFAIDNNFDGVGLLIYSLVLITPTDYVARLTILKRLMNVHPLITIFGVIVGITLFGFWGVIFGPLFISYFIILIKIYINEFGKPSP